MSLYGYYWRYVKGRDLTWHYMPFSDVTLVLKTEFDITPLTSDGLTTEQATRFVEKCNEDYRGVYLFAIQPPPEIDFKKRRVRIR